MEDQKTKKSIFKKWWFWVIVVIVLFIILGSSGSKNTNNTVQQNQNNPAQQQSYTRVAAVDLAAEYKANQVAADDKYKNKTIEVSGTIYNIGKDILDAPYVVLSGTDMVTNIQCMFDKSDQSQLTSLAKDTKIVLRGKVSGQVVFNVLLNNCSIVE
ncbi:MAG TPA: hypothetical protein PLG37_02645 [Candidatus Pacearchaeota archaeon]|nr:hypothetical protein [Candidatus Pacearchaeota archaeon]